MMWIHLAMATLSCSFLCKKDLFGRSVRQLYKCCSSTLGKLSYPSSYYMWLQVLEVQSSVNSSGSQRAGWPAFSNSEEVGRTWALQTCLCSACKTSSEVPFEMIV